MKDKKYIIIFCTILAIPIIFTAYTLVAKGFDKNQTSPFLLTDPYDLKGKVTKVLDGDTIIVNSEKIRFSLIDTPEIGQRGYKEATQYTKSNCLDKTATL
jgi:micrococcal nuclease